jgi:hypothetical protein
MGDGNNYSTLPINNGMAQNAPYVILANYYHDPVNGALYVHKDMVETVKPWDDTDRIREYVPPIAGTVGFGDVASFAAYLQRYGDPALTFTTWNAGGIQAILDYHGDVIAGNPAGRCQWVAQHSFIMSLPLTRWVSYANGSSRDQRGLIEFLEDMADTIVQPSAAELTSVLSLLRSTFGSRAETNLKEDGSYAVSFSKEAKLTAQGVIPSTFTIRVPLLAGHTDDEGKTVTYDLTVRLRMTPIEQSVTFRLSISNLTVSLEDAYADRVKVATALLGKDFPILRSAN